MTAVQRRIQLPIATPIQTNALGVARPDRHWCGAIVAGKRRARAEAAHIGSLPNQLGRGQRTTAEQAEQAEQDWRVDLSSAGRYPK